MHVTDHGYDATMTTMTMRMCMFCKLLIHKIAPVNGAASVQWPVLMEKTKLG